MVDPTHRPDSIEPFLSEEVPTLSNRTGTGQVYLPPSQLQLLEQLEHLSRYSHFIQIVTGVSGSGKSTLLQQFYQVADDSAVHSCLIQLSQPTHAASLLNQINQQLNLDHDTDPQQQLQALLQHCQLLQQLSKQLLIVIDDAEALQADALELLFNQLSALDDEEQRPHLVLFATPELREQLANPSLSAVVESSCHFFELEPLESIELNALLEHSYSAVAARLNDDTRAQLLKESLGLPGRVPRVIEAIMSGQVPTAEPAQNTNISTNIGTQSSTPKRSPRWPWVTMLLVLPLIAGGWLLWPQLQQFNQFDPDAERIRVEIPVSPKPINEAPADPAPPAPHGSDFEQRLAQARAALEAEQQQEQPQPEPPMATPETTVPQQLELAPIKPVAQTEPQASEPSTEQQPTAANQSEQLTPTSPQAEAGDQSGSNTLVLELPPVTDSTTTDSPDSSVQGTTSPTAAEPTKVYFGDGNELLEWNRSGYTLQMLGARQEKSVGRFVASMPEQEKLKRFYTFYKQKPWYVVVYGRYSSRSAAMAAIGDLPPALRARRPWARSIAGVQDDIRKGEN
ncbi:NACHT domain-containing protein [Motiliproteus coralliicola]|uniref:NACHT domain-containing protein n=1 Tax=Motiliproteus coralliicola TaxID=2283196 RepID=A0A369WI24_9GAMM|nr:AAA family ATPase [Motiliproteus coralliicola]RDE19105.1 NACHT domain-containing protein [Motiliproteus coralliicola]